MGGHGTTAWLHSFNFDNTYFFLFLSLETAIIHFKIETVVLTTGHKLNHNSKSCDLSRTSKASDVSRFECFHNNNTLNCDLTIYRGCFFTRVCQRGRYHCRVSQALTLTLVHAAISDPCFHRLLLVFTWTCSISESASSASMHITFGSYFLSILVYIPKQSKTNTDTETQVNACSCSLSKSPSCY